MIVALTREFRFEAAHTLQRQINADSSKRIHGHSYQAEVTVRGPVDPQSGMVMDLGFLAQHLEKLHAALDHRLLDDVEGLGAATMENLAVWIWKRLAPDVPALFAVTVRRDSLCERCEYYGPQK